MAQSEAERLCEAYKNLLHRTRAAHAVDQNIGKVLDDLDTDTSDPKEGDAELRQELARWALCAMHTNPPSRAMGDEKSPLTVIANRIRIWRA
jgi:hypothetical protein